MNNRGRERQREGQGKSVHIQPKKPRIVAITMCGQQRGNEQQCSNQTQRGGPSWEQIAQKIVEAAAAATREEEASEVAGATTLVANGCCWGNGQKFKQLFIMKYNKKW